MQPPQLITTTVVRLLHMQVRENTGFRVESALPTRPELGVERRSAARAPQPWVRLGSRRGVTG